MLTIAPEDHQLLLFKVPAIYNCSNNAEARNAHGNVGGVLRVAYGANVQKLKTLPAEEFPAEPRDRFAQIGLACTELADGIEAVKWSASTDQVRYNLCTVHVTGSAKQMTCVAADLRQLSVWKSALIGADFEATIPSGFAGNLAKTPTAVVTFKAKECTVEFVGQDSDLAYQIDGKFEPIELRLSADTFKRVLAAIGDDFKLSVGDSGIKFPVVLENGNLTIYTTQIDK